MGGGKRLNLLDVPPIAADGADRGRRDVHVADRRGAEPRLREVVVRPGLRRDHGLPPRGVSPPPLIEVRLLRRGGRRAPASYPAFAGRLAGDGVLGRGPASLVRWRALARLRAEPRAWLGLGLGLGLGLRLGLGLGLGLG